MSRAEVTSSNFTENLSDNDESQIIDLTIQNKLNTEFRPYFLISGMLLFFTILEWLRWQKVLPPMPVFFSFLFLISAVFAYFKQCKFKQEFGFLNHGKQGEKSIKEYFDVLKSVHKARIFTNIKLGDYEFKNIIIGRFGVLVIDIVDIPLPMNGDANILYMDKKITVNGYPLDHDPVDELMQASVELKTLLEEGSNKNFSIKGIVLFPNWYVQQHDDSNIKVMNPRELVNAYQELEEGSIEDDQSLISYHLNKYIRMAK